jgi:hypothetical protein
MRHPVDEAFAAVPFLQSLVKQAAVLKICIIKINFHIPTFVN